MREFTSKVMTVNDGKYITLEESAFYPSSGGQPHDTGKIIRDSDGKEFEVVFVGKFNDKISHEVTPDGLAPGDKIHATIDWKRRYTLMKMHTAAHVLSRVLYEETGANTSGNQLGLEKSRIDFTLENYDKEKIIECVEKANQIIKSSAEVKKTFMNREEALKIEGFAGPSPHLMQEFETLRVVDIAGIDAQPCGGTHLDNIDEIGGITFIKAENKGKNNRRVYYGLE